PAYDDDWWDAWSAYRRVNERFAEAVCEHSPEGAAVLVQDYHLTLVAPTVSREQPDLSLVHFHHTPFAGPDGLRVLPAGFREELLSSLAAHHACGFHTAWWAANFTASLEEWPPADLADGKGAVVFASTLSTDPDDLRATAGSPECAAQLRSLDELVGDRQVVVRVDRMELSKNIVRGFAAFDLLLARRADLRGKVVFLARCYPSRQSVPA